MPSKPRLLTCFPVGSHSAFCGIVALPLTALTAGGGRAGDAPPRIPMLPQPPVIDGEMGAKEWSGSLHYKDFHETSFNASNTTIPEGLRTEVHCARTPSALCVAFRCFHGRKDQMVTAVTSHDGPVWEDDSVEVFLDAQDTQFSYYHFVINARGALYDASNNAPRRGDMTWDSGANSAGKILPDGYSVEISLALSALNLGLNEQHKIGLNFCRNVRYVVGRQSLFGDYHSPTTWKTFALSQTGPAHYPISTESIDWSPFSGMNDLTARFRNLARSSLRLSGQLVVEQGQEETVQKFNLGCGAHQTTEVRLPYRVTADALARIRLVLRNGKGEELLSLYRIVQPKQVATISVDTDVLLRGENPNVEVAFAIAQSSAQTYSLKFTVRTPEGTKLFETIVPSAPRMQLVYPLDLSALPSDTERIEIETTIADVTSGKQVFQGNTPLRVIDSPWANPE